jgi:hypothetical protein
MAKRMGAKTIEVKASHLALIPIMTKSRARLRTPPEVR